MYRNFLTGTTTLARFILIEQRMHPQATGSFSMILEQVAFAAKLISREVTKAGIANIIGAASTANTHGETQQKLDIFANSKMIQSLNHLGLLCGMASEEDDSIIPIPENYPKGNYMIAFDPLDGSSNIDVNTSIGTIFGIYKKKNTSADVCKEEFLQPGKDLVASGYIIYGSSTMFVYSTGSGVNGFTLDPSVGEFILSHPNIKIPKQGNIYSVNEGNYNKWSKNIKNYVDSLKNDTENPYTGRYIGSLVADFHRNLLKGGVFLYPEDTKNPKGKLRILYEAIPLAFIAKQAGGEATDGINDILDIYPTSIHQRVPLCIGSKHEVDLYKKFYSEGI